ncbi:MAG TPA: PA domain-containing protein, partial [Capillimicrobium sp.]
MPQLAPRAAVVAAALALVACGAAEGRPAADPGARAAAPAPAAAAAPASAAQHLRALARITNRHGGTRLAGSPGYDAAARYVERTLRAAGYRTRRQPVSFPYFEVTRPSLLAVDGRRLRIGRDFRTIEWTGSGDVTGAVRPVAVRFGRPSTSGCERTDFGALRAGEIALLQRGGCEFVDKTRNAERAGAAAVLIANEGAPGRTGAFRASLRAPGADIPALSLSEGAGRRL